MRYLKRQNINRRVANDTTLYSDVSNTNIFVSPVNSGSLVLPNGTTGQRNGTNLGSMRYNTTTNEVEVYQGSVGSNTANWRSLRYQESGKIIQQNLGAGDGLNTLFGPLNSAYNTNKLYYSSDIPSGGGAAAGQFVGQNALVVVENVLQLSGTNYTVVASPSVGGETYTPTVSQAATTGATTLYFSTSLIGTGTSSSGSISFTGFISNGSAPSGTAGTTLTVVSGSAPTTGQTLSNNGVTAGTTIVAANVSSFTGYTSGTTLTVTSITSSIITLGMIITGSNMTAGTYISALGTGVGGAGNYTLSTSQGVASGSSGSPVNLTGTSYTVSVSQSTASGSITASGVTATINFATQTGVPFAIGDTIVVTGFTPTVYNGKFSVTASSTSSVSYSSPAIGSMITAGTVTSNTAVYPAVNILGAVVSGSASVPTSTTLSSVQIVGSLGQFQCASTTLAVNQAITISGTAGQTYPTAGSISGYTNPTTYYIITTNGTTTFTLSLSPGGTAITTAVGTPTGLTYTVPTCVLSYLSDATTDALLSVTISKATITSTIPILTAITITEPTTTYAGNYLQFTSPVPLGKVVTALLGFDA